MASLKQTVNDNPAQVKLLGELEDTIDQWKENVTERFDDYGVVVQLGYMLVADKIEPFVRYELLSFDKARGYVENDVNLITAGANYHVNSNFKFGFDVVWALDPVPTDSFNAGLLADGVEEDQIVVRAQAQLKF